MKGRLSDFNFNQLQLQKVENVKNNSLRGLNAFEDLRKLPFTLAKALILLRTAPAMTWTTESSRAPLKPHEFEPIQSWSREVCYGTLSRLEFHAIPMMSPWFSREWQSHPSPLMLRTSRRVYTNHLGLPKVRSFPNGCWKFPHQTIKTPKRHR